MKALFFTICTVALLCRQALAIEYQVADSPEPSGLEVQPAETNAAESPAPSDRPNEGRVGGIVTEIDPEAVLKKPSGNDASAQNSTSRSNVSNIERKRTTVRQLFGYAELYLEVPFQSQVQITNQDTDQKYYVKQQGGHRALLVPIWRPKPARSGISVSLPDARTSDTAPSPYQVYVDMKSGDRRHVRVSRKEIQERLITRSLVNSAAFSGKHAVASSYTSTMEPGSVSDEHNDIQQLLSPGETLISVEPIPSAPDVASDGDADSEALPPPNSPVRDENFGEPNAGDSEVSEPTNEEDFDASADPPVDAAGGTENQDPFEDQDPTIDTQEE